MYSAFLLAAFLTLIGFEVNAQMYILPPSGAVYDSTLAQLATGSTGSASYLGQSYTPNFKGSIAWAFFVGGGSGSLTCTFFDGDGLYFPVLYTTNTNTANGGIGVLPPKGAVPVRAGQPVTYVCQTADQSSSLGGPVSANDAYSKGRIWRNGLPINQDLWFYFYIYPDLVTDILQDAAGGGNGGNRVGQSFIVSNNGSLAIIRPYFSPSGVNTTCKIVAGNTTSGTVLFTQTFAETASTQTPLQIVVPKGLIPVQPGQMFAFECAATTGTQFGARTANNASAYIGGTLFIDGNAVADDLYFAVFLYSADTPNVTCDTLAGLASPTSNSWFSQTSPAQLSSLAAAILSASTLSCPGAQNSRSFIVVSKSPNYVVQLNGAPFGQVLSFGNAALCVFVPIAATADNVKTWGLTPDVDDKSRALVFFFNVERMTLAGAAANSDQMILEVFVTVNVAYVLIFKSNDLKGKTVESEGGKKEMSSSTKCKLTLPHTSTVTGYGDSTSSSSGSSAGLYGLFALIVIPIIFCFALIGYGLYTWLHTPQTMEAGMDIEAEKQVHAPQVYAPQPMQYMPQAYIHPSSQG